MVVGRAFGALAGGIFRAGKFTAKHAWRGAYQTHRFGTETLAGTAQGAANIGRRATGRPTVDILSEVAQTRGAALGARLMSDDVLHGVAGAAGRAGNIAGRTAWHAGTAVGGAGLVAGRVGARAFRQVPRDLANPLGFEMKRGARWAVGLGALGVGTGLGYRDYQQQRRVGTVYPQGQLRELGYDAVPNVPEGTNDLGATGDLVFALNNLR